MGLLSCFVLFIIQKPQIIYLMIQYLFFIVIHLEQLFFSSILLYENRTIVISNDFFVFAIDHSSSKIQEILNVFVSSFVAFYWSDDDEEEGIWRYLMMSSLLLLCGNTSQLQSEKQVYYYNFVIYFYYSSSFSSKGQLSNHVHIFLANCLELSTACFILGVKVTL